LALVVGLGALLLTESAIRAQVAPALGTVAQFAVLGNSAVTGSTGSGTVVNGSVGSFPTSSITNFPPSTVAPGHTLHLAANATVQQAQADARTAYNALAAQGGTVISNNLATVGALVPGVYALGAADLPATSSLTLNGAGIFIFNVASTLTMNVGSSVIGSANPCNVYWRVGTSATLNGTSFMGTVIADASITLGSGSVTGRLLAGTGATGAVTMATGGNTVGGCSDAQLAPTVSKAFNPTSIAAGATSQLTITLNNPNSSAISLLAALTDTLPSGLLVAAVPAVSTTCGGTASATAGGSTVSLASGATLAAGSCTITVTVTAAASGTYVNTIAAGALQTSAGNNAAAASATLLVPVVCPVITLSPLTLPGGTVGVAYSQAITGSGGTAPYTFAVTTGTLPAGLTLTAAGVLAGTPTAAGASPVTIRATDGSSCTGALVATITIAPVGGCPVITIAPATAPNGLVGTPYSQTLTASGGTAPYTFTLASGTLPTGLALTNVEGSGRLSGTPTANGSYSFTIRATDANACPADRPYVVVITTAVPTMPQMFLILLAIMLATVGFMLVRRA
jgi:hypothetical protein